MHKVFVVAKREYQAAVKTKSFLISLFLMPLLMGGARSRSTCSGDRLISKKNDLPSSIDPKGSGSLRSWRPRPKNVTPTRSSIARQASKQNQPLRLHT